MSDDLRLRLDRLATELTRGATTSPPEAARRRGRRHRRRQAVLGGLLVVAVAGVAAGPGAGLLDRRQATVATPVPPTTVAVPALAVPRVATGEFAAVIQDPPAGFPARIRGRVTGCGPIDMPTFAYPQLVIGEVRYRGKWVVFNLAPFPATRYEPPVKFRVPWVNVSRMALDGNGGLEWPLMLAEQPDTRLELERADGSRGSIVGAYRVIRYHHRNGSVVGAETVRGLIGAQVAMAWDCGRFAR